MSVHRVLVTGGSGFVGINLVQHFLDQGVEVVNADVRPSRNPAHASVWRETDLLDGAAVRAVVDELDPTHIVHLGARTDLRGTTLADYAVNYDGTRTVVDAARGRSSLERVVFASTRLVCRIGYIPRSDDDYAATTPYGESKIEAEKLVRASGLDVPWVIVRPTSIWGPWFEIPYRTFFDTIRKGRYVHPRGRQIRKSFGYVGNSVHQLDGLLRCDADLVHGKTFYLADDPPIEVLDMAQRIRRAFGAPPVRSVPVPVLRVLAKAGDAARAAGWAEPPLTSFRLDNLLTEMVFDVPLQEITGPPPHRLDDAIAETVRWIETHGSAPSAH
ncbi:MAG TPA: NAD(P)-dependent oxidoreductase [Solirubrobacteraceae bacterium]|nr:NAD(P)-dependent oxidoreductase [Solirubrobacteraceae bacterium]